MIQKKIVRYGDVLNYIIKKHFSSKIVHFCLGNILEFLCIARSQQEYCQKGLALKKGCCHSSVDLSAPSILLPRVRIPSTPSKLFHIIFELYWIDENKQKDWPIFLKNISKSRTGHNLFRLLDASFREVFLAFPCPILRGPAKWGRNKIPLSTKTKSQKICLKVELKQEGGDGCHSSVDSSAPSILQSLVQIRCTPSMVLGVELIFLISVWPEKNRQKSTKVTQIWFH